MYLVISRVQFSIYTKTQQIGAVWLTELTLDVLES